ncbi:MAG: preprotein translocase subunit YajC [Clostridiales bacterium]|nr:preprotein translocase subunit YajC [Clostridiales bacterium]
MAMILQFGLIALMIVIMYFILIRPQRKKQKEEAKMRDNLQVGDEIVTIGGIVGKVVSMKEDSILIETGADRDKVRIMKWAVQTNNTVHDK